MAAPLAALQRAARAHEVLTIWARAIGCAPGQVTEIIARAGIPTEKLWNSIGAATRRQSSG